MWSNCSRRSCTARITPKTSISAGPGSGKRWEAGQAHTKAVIAREPWAGQFDPLLGVILHEAKGLTALAAE
jgi:hypothetical protein